LRCRAAGCVGDLAGFLAAVCDDLAAPMTSEGLYLDFSPVLSWVARSAGRFATVEAQEPAGSCRARAKLGESVRCSRLLVAAGTFGCSAAAGDTHSRDAARSCRHAKGHDVRGDAQWVPPARPRTSRQRADLGQGAAAFGVGLSVATGRSPMAPRRTSTKHQPARAAHAIEILYPTLGVKRRVMPWAPPAYRYGPYPVIVFAHGFDVTPTPIVVARVWVEAGYVVVAPFFPDTSLAASKPARSRHRVRHVQPAR